MLGMVAGPLTSIFGLLILLFYLGYGLTRARIEEIQTILAVRRREATTQPAQQGDRRREVLASLKSV